MEKKIIILLVLILIGIGVSGCGVKTVKVQEVEEEQIEKPTEMETISRLEGIAFVLGCMFDPTPCQEKKEAQEHEDRKR